jgi:hypothetical protein
VFFGDRRFGNAYIHRSLFYLIEAALLHETMEQNVPFEPEYKLMFEIIEMRPIIGTITLYGSEAGHITGLL